LSVILVVIVIVVLIVWTNRFLINVDKPELSLRFVDERHVLRKASCFEVGITLVVVDEADLRVLVRDVVSFGRVVVCACISGKLELASARSRSAIRVSASQSIGH
jgi:hypothetical protein